GAGMSKIGVLPSVPSLVLTMFAATIAAGWHKHITGTVLDVCSRRRFAALPCLELGALVRRQVVRGHLRPIQDGVRLALRHFPCGLAVIAGNAAHARIAAKVGGVHAGFFLGGEPPWRRDGLLGLRGAAALAPDVHLFRRIAARDILPKRGIAEAVRAALVQPVALGVLGFCGSAETFVPGWRWEEIAACVRRSRDCLASSAIGVS